MIYNYQQYTITNSVIYTNTHYTPATNMQKYIMLLLLILLLQHTPTLCEEAPVITDVSPVHVLANEQMLFDISVSGFGFSNISTILISGHECLPTENNYSIFSAPCLRTRTREAMCGIVKLQNGALTTNPCDMNETPCFNRTIGSSVCLPLTSRDDMCRNIMCKTVTNSCVLYVYTWLTGFANGSNFEGVACDVDKACSPELKCVPDNPVDICKNTVTCRTRNIPEGPANITVIFSNNATITNMSVTVNAVPQPNPTRYHVAANVDVLFSDVLYVSPTTTFDLVYSPPLADINASVQLMCTDDFGQNPPFNITDAFPSDLVFPPQLAGPSNVLPIHCRFFVTYTDKAYSIVLPSLTISASYVRTPVLASVCPFAILSEVPTAVIIQGTYFRNTSLLLCRFGNNTATPAVYLSETSVRCDIIYPNRTNSSVQVELAVTNDLFAYSVSALVITVSGACDTLKPNSVPQDARCVCTPGFSDMGGFCQACRDGTYQSLYDQQSCIPCDGTEDTQGATGQLSRTACVCKDNMYRSSTDETACVACPVGFSCKQNEGVTVLSGFWLAKSNTTLTTRCLLGSTQCRGGAGSGDALCAKGYTGPLCSVCADGYGPLGGECLACPVDGLNSFIVFLLISVSAILFYFLVRATTRLEQKGDLAGVTIKVTFSYLQLLYYIGKTAANWNGQSSQFFAAIIPVTMSSSFISIHCSTKYGFYNTIAMMMVLPLVVVCGMAVIMTASYFFKRMTQERNLIILETRQDFERYCLVILVIVHPTISQDLIRSFRCQDVSGTGTSYLVDDMSVDCSTGAYQRYRIVASMYMVFYVLGLLLYILYKMMKNDALVKMADAGIYAFEGRIFVFFMRGYRSDVYLWEFAIMLRKMAVVIINSLLVPEIQLVWTNIVIAISLGVTVIVRPFKSLLVNRLEILAIASLWFVVLLGMHNQLLINPNAKSVFVILVLVSTITTAVLFASVFKTLQPLIREMFAHVDSLVEDVLLRIRPIRGREFNDSSYIPPGVRMYQNPATKTVPFDKTSTDHRNFDEVEL